MRKLKVEITREEAKFIVEVFNRWFPDEAVKRTKMAKLSNELKKDKPSPKEENK